MTYFSQMVGLTVQNFASAAVGIVVAVALIRGIAGRSGSLGNFYQDMVRTILYVLVPLSFVGALVLVSQGSPANLSHYVTAHGLSGSRRSSRWARSPRRRRSRCSAPTAAASSTRTRRCRSRTRTASPTSSRCCSCSASRPRSCSSTGGWSARAARRSRSSRRCSCCSSARVVVAYAAEANGSPAQHAAGLHTTCRRGLDRRQPRGQGAALRDRRLGAVRRRHDGHLLRRGEQLDRVLHRARRRGPVREPLGERGDLRRRRRRAVLDPALRPARRLHRRADGRANARVPRREDRGARRSSSSRSGC